MHSANSTARLARAALAAAACVTAAACSLVAPVSAPDGAGPPQTEREGSAPASRPEPAPAAAEVPPASERPAPPLPKAPPPARPGVLLVGGADGPVGRRIADALETALSDRYRLERGELGAAAEGYFSAAIAVGLEAAERAARELAVPVVYCRVFDVERIRAIRPRLYGVAALPPLQMQLEAWQRLAPSGSTVGMIVSDGHRALVNAAREAAQARGLELEAAFARSDRELLYRFKRLVPHIDALWLFPDNEILSPGVVRETLDYAREHGVHSIVFTASLLEWGALISVESRADDVAANVAGVLADVTAGAAPPPAMTPLSRARVRVNDEVAAELGLRVRVSARETGVH